MLATQSQVDALAAQLARMPGVPERLAVLHHDDGTGRCVVCSGGAQTGRYTWPCSISMVATRAIEMRSSK